MTKKQTAEDYLDRFVREKQFINFKSFKSIVGWNGTVSPIFVRELTEFFIKEIKLAREDERNKIFKETIKIINNKIKIFEERRFGCCGKGIPNCTGCESLRGTIFVWEKFKEKLRKNFLSNKKGV